MYFSMMIGFAALGFWVLFSSRDLIRQALASYRWATTEGVIVDLTDASFTTPGLTRIGGIGEVAYHEVTHVYEYQVGGQTYQSSNYCFGAHIERAEAAFSAGTKVKVYYDPLDPKNAVLRRGLQPSLFLGPFWLGTALFIAIHLLWRKIHPS
jgi:hypothetical protein